MHLLMWHSLPLAYIGPQLGLPFVSMGAAMIAVLMAFLVGLLGPFKFLWNHFRKFGPVRLSAALAVLFAAALGGATLFMAQPSKTPHLRVIVLGLDGLDPNLVDDFLAQGALPNFERLRKQGSYARLGTSNPALSPVAWSSFITGANPARHGMFDFLRRDPKTYLPDLSFADVEEPKPLFRIGSFKFTLEAPKLKSHRKGVAFWDITSRERIPTTVLRTPVTFPPDRVHGRMLAGLGTPDLRGGQGTFSFYTTADIEGVEKLGGRIVSVKFGSDTIETDILGPRNTLQKPAVETAIPLALTVHRSNPHVTIQLPNETFDVGVGEWSDWKTLTFELNSLTKVPGIARFYLKSVEPDFQLYLSPINFDPRSPAFPISYPAGYAKELADAIGLYHTLGQAEDTWSLNEGRVAEETFLEQCDRVIAEREAMLLHELKRFKAGLLTCVFDTPDRIQHMFWRYRDTQHPLYNAEEAKRFENVFLNVYQRMDGILGKVLEYVDERTVLLVLSDHGFSEFRTAVHTNALLEQAGLLKLKTPSKPGEANEFFSNVDWSQTRAYAAGLAGLYVNRQGRERFGIVPPNQASEVAAEVERALLAVRDPGSGAPVLRRVYRREEIYEGPYLDEGPDLVVGFEEGYRTSWQTALGGTPAVAFEPNAKRWSGDHCVDPPFVPGVLLINRPLAVTDPRIIDIAPTILKLLECEIPPSVDGRPLIT